MAVKLAGRAEAELQERHVTGQEVLAGLRAHALALFGPLGKAVWSSWGIHSTLDWGKVVFLLVENGHLRRQESDTLEDFRDGFDFESELVRAYRVPLGVELGGGEDAG